MWTTNANPQKESKTSSLTQCSHHVEDVTDD
jgi:hypothetical protein